MKEKETNSATSKKSVEKNVRPESKKEAASKRKISRSPQGATQGAS